jgi:DNA-sulfur modification-associated
MKILNVTRRSCVMELAVNTPKPAPFHTQGNIMSNITYKPLGELDDAVDTTERPFKVFYNNNMGNKTFLIKMPIYDFYRMSDIANEQNPNVASGEISQRPIDVGHANKLANYVLKGLVHAVIARNSKLGKVAPAAYDQAIQLLGKQPYIALQPLVCNLRNCERDGSDLKGRTLEVSSNTGMNEIAAYEVLLSQQHVLWVIDGQHRRKAVQYVFEFLDHVLAHHSYPNRKSIYPVANKSVSNDELELWRDCNEVARSFCTLAAEVHLGLNADEERQLFHDLNNLSKKVEAGLALEFDRGNPVNTFIQDQLLKGLLHWPISKKDIINWQDDDGSITRKDLTSINTRLLLNKTNPRGATPATVEPRIEVAKRFWGVVQSIPHLGVSGAKYKTVAAQPVVLKALAKLTFDFAFGKSGKKDPGLLDRLFDGVVAIDFSHQNPMWRYYQLNLDEIDKFELVGIENFVPGVATESGDYNRNIGLFDQKSGLMRFGAKHNDIYPIIGDMIRWSLKLPSRRK